ncbi:L-xylo-3-hexulose reductase [Erysiphe necator]|uniref:Putative 3-oxoacyl-(Acyl-carrier-protein) reductase 1 n=1 Tax=Uncinula necator TaxID=52586 RepID=A0A0B1PB35_UNCNE|nr:L-xylo-3-hexulose reductase [Erysiphe necator]KHJ34560.1 putative 3-oxoacyl-(acyl-carrier-protein) reductase 1 [Erysiphe necator]
MSTANASYRPLEGKIALVTGASRGIGAAIAQNLASKGAKIILNYTSPSSSQICIDLATKLQESYGVEHLVVQADMGSLNGPSDIIKTAAAKIPNLRLDIIINNAGVLKVAKLADTTVEDFEKVYSVNVRGPLLLVKAAIPYLPNDRSGRIVNVSSVSATFGGVEQSVYGGSKAALDAMTRTWSRELADHATVNSINPGPVLTDMMKSAMNTELRDEVQPIFKLTPLAKLREGIDDENIVEFAKILGGRPAYAEEIAGIVGMLVSSESGWCTGQVICANGGLRLAT